MPALVLLKSPGGVAPGETIPLDGESFVVGRDADACQIVIPHHAVSRRHAQITRSQGKYFIEDLRSRNHTYVNNAEIAARVPLAAEDRIKICDFLFRFQDDRTPKKRELPAWMAKGEETDAAGPAVGGEMTTFEASLPRAAADNLLDTQPAERLRAILEISTSLSRTLELGPLLDQVAETLFRVFKQADRCFVILLDDAGRPVPKVIKSRRPGTDDARFSRTIVNKAIGSMESYLSEDASTDMNLGPSASIAEFRIRSVMCVPLPHSNGKALGALQLDTQDRNKKFREDDLKLLTIVANLAAVAVEKARLHESMLLREREQQEIELAKQVQLGFLPQTVPQLPGYEFYSHYSPANTVGGDYYDFVHLHGLRVEVVVGDVAGKGVPAALLTAKLSSEVRFWLLTRPTPAEAMCGLNDALMRGGLGDRFVTMLIAVLDPCAHTLTVANAGHMNPKLFSGCRGEFHDACDGAATGLPLGVMPGYVYEECVLPLTVGDTLILFTDGVTDAMNPAGDLFGDEGIDRAFPTDDTLAADLGRPARLGERLIQSVRRHAGGRAQYDDIAVVSFGRVDPAHGPATNTGLATGSVKVADTAPARPVLG